MGSVPFDTADHAMIAPRRFRRAFMFNFDVRDDRSVFGICRNETVIALVYIARKVVIAYLHPIVSVATVYNLLSI